MDNLTTIKKWKKWELFKPDADQSDADFLFGLDCKVNVSIPDPEVFETHGKYYQYTSQKQPSIEIITTCEKQEMMLKLKYGDSIILKFVHYENQHLVSHR